MNKKRIKKYLIITLVLIEFISIALTYKSFMSRNLNEIKEESIVDRKRFAMYISNDTGGYDEYTSSNFFPKGYKLNLDKSSCIDINGNILSGVLTGNGNNVTVTSNKTMYCYLYFDELPPDIKVIVSTDGTSGILPTGNTYTQTLSCTNATAEYSSRYRRIEVSALTPESECNLDYVKDTSTKTTLASVVQGSATSVKCDCPVQDSYATISQSEYGSTSQFYSKSDSSTSGTSVTNAFTYDSTNNQWISIPENLSSNKYYHINLPVTKTGYYKLCYTIGPGSENNRLYIYKNGSIIGSYISAYTSSSNSACVDLEYVTSGTDYIKVTQRAYNTIATMSFYLQQTSTTETVDTGYRYTGKNPNNYVWFNNEMWRIIGLIPTCTASGCSTKENLVKIIRNASIGGLAYDAKSYVYTGAWGSNTLYKLLNDYYYGRSDGTNSGYCYGNYDSSYQPIVGCDYTNIGISSDSTDYYGRMVKNVYWNTGASAHYVSASAVYTTETATQTVQGRIGLMAASDFGYAASTSYHSTSMNSYSSAVATDWLYGQGYEWTSIQDSSNSYRALYVNSNGSLIRSGAASGNAARPVVYLDSSVYKITGEGTQANPYIIGM